MPDHPHRRIALDGATNFRDLGGYRSQDGQFVRWRKLFRSENLAGLSAADIKRIAAYGVGRTFDFRGIEERAAAPYQLPGVLQHSLAIEPTVAQDLAEMVRRSQTLTASKVEQMMERLYVHLIDEQSGRYAQMFELLLDEDSAVIFHCTAGKDRTGVAAALMLSALGVPRDIIDRDFLLTNDFYRRPASSQATEMSDEVLAVLWRVQPSFLQIALHTIETRHGGVENYLTERLSLNSAARRALIARYLTPVDDFAEG